FENEFPTIVYNDALRSKSELLTELNLNPQHIDKFDLNDETLLSGYDEEEQNVLYFNDLFPCNIIRPYDLRLENDNDDNDIDIIQSSEDMALPPREQRNPFLRYQGLEYTDADIKDFETRLARIYRREVHMVDAQGAILDLDTPGELQFQLGGVRRRMSWRQFILALGLHTDEEMQTAGSTPSYTTIRDVILRLCHRLITCSIAGRSQEPEKVTVTNIFYLRGMDVDSVNVPYLLARYLRLFTAGRKSEAHISGGQFVARLAEHFGLLTAKILRGFTVIAPDLPIIDMAELPDAAAHTPRVAQDALVIDLDGQAAKTMPQRMARLEEDMHEIREALTEQREVIDVMAHDISRFCTWTTTSLARMMDKAGVSYTSYSQIPREY
ncbi:hypothetical protein Tco_1061286, partial [Tanacetum coccineum]